MEPCRTRIAMLLLLVLVLLGASAAAADDVKASALPLWQMNVGTVAPQSYTSYILSRDGATVYTMWSANNWAPRPTYFLLALDATTGSMSWNASLFGVQQTNQQYFFSEGSRSLYVTNIYSGQILAIDKSTGGTRWLVTPFQNSGFGLTAYGAVEGLLDGSNDDSAVVYIDNSRSGFLLNASTGLFIPSYATAPLPFPGLAPVLWRNATGFTYAIFQGAYLNVYVTVESSSNNNITAALAWNVTSKSSGYPSFLTADASVAIVSQPAGAGVPQILALDSNTGELLWRQQFYNNPSAFVWAALTESLAISMLGSTLLAFDRASGNVTWQQPIVNRTNQNPMLVKSGALLAVPWSDGSRLLLSTYSTSNGALVETRVVSAPYDSWYQSAQLAVSGSTNVIIASISSSSQSSSQGYNILLAVPLSGSHPPVGVTLRTFPSSMDCSGAYQATIVPTGCTKDDDDDGSVMRTCSGATVQIDIYKSSTAAACSGVPSETYTWNIGQCYADVEGSFLVESCSTK